MKLGSYPLEPLQGSVADRPLKVFKVPNRVATNVLAHRERQLLTYLCRITPAWVTPDHLTALGVIGALITAFGYVAGDSYPGFLFLASFGLVVNWLGDSLDGSLARYRKAERQRYGFFVDNSVDVISEFIILAGLGLSPYVSMSVALFALCGYLALSLYVFLVHQTCGDHLLSFASLGPTEARLVIMLLNLAMFVTGPAQLSILGLSVPLYSAIVGLGGAALFAIFVANVSRTARELARESRIEADRSLAVENVSTSSNRVAYSPRRPRRSAT